MRSFVRLVVLVTLSVLGLAACSRTRALGARPDTAGVWDVTYDDVMDVEVRTGNDAYRTRVSASGGHVTFHDAGEQTDLDIACERDDVSCPSELWPSELTLDNRTGQVNDDGDHLRVSFAGRGRDACRLVQGSAAEANIETRGVPVAPRWQATVLSDGHMTAALDAACFGARAGLPKDAVVVLRVGFTASRR